MTAPALAGFRRGKQILHPTLHVRRHASDESTGGFMTNLIKMTNLKKWTSCLVMGTMFAAPLASSAQSYAERHRRAVAQQDYNNKQHHTGAKIVGGSALGGALIGGLAGGGKGALIGGAIGAGGGAVANHVRNKRAIHRKERAYPR